MTVLDNLRVDGLVKHEKGTVYRILYISDRSVLLKNIEDGHEFLENQSMLSEYKVIGFAHKSVRQLRNFIHDTNNSYDVNIYIVDDKGSRYKYPVCEMERDMLDMSIGLVGHDIDKELVF